MSAAALRAGAILTVDLDAVVANWRLLSKLAEGAECAAVVKADAYGLGAGRVGAALQAAGCRTFFVAHLEEGLELRKAIGFSSRVFVLNGTPAGTESEFLNSVLIPVVNTAGELAAWRDHAREKGRSMPVALQLDTGMSRLGLSPGDVAELAGEPMGLGGLSVELVMSHLACADAPAHPANGRQRRAFAKLRTVLPRRAASSLANSAGILLGPEFRFDLVRPGAALYGINPVPEGSNPFRQAVTLSTRVIQIREVPAGTSVGYGHAWTVERQTPPRDALARLRGRLATCCEHVRLLQGTTASLRGARIDGQHRRRCDRLRQGPSRRRVRKSHVSRTDRGRCRPCRRHDRL